MTLTLAECAVTIDWQGDEFYRLASQSNEYALAACARDAIEYIQEAAPYETGSLQSSIHAAEPGYFGDEELIYNRRILGVYQMRAVPSIGELIGLIRDDAIWVGTWIPYGYYVDQGFYNVAAGKDVPGKQYIIPNAERGLRNYPDHFRADWPNRLQREGSAPL